MSFLNTETQIRVACRVRPLNQMEISQGGQIAVTSNDKTIKIKVQGDDSKNEFTFDNIFGPDSKQTQIFQLVAKPIVDSVMKGFNGTIFAYGQTSSGKTFTMEGPSIDSEENKGLIPRMMDEIFDCIMRANENIEFTVKVSFLEIYNEKIHDLLDVRKNNLHIKEEKARGIYVQDATEIYVNNVEQMKRVMKTGAENRTIAATKMNERSSRSHSLFILSLFQKDIENETTKQSSLFFVDLAGSEKIAKTHVTGQQLEEAKNINKSLSALGNVINALTSDKKEHIPYRDSKLTRILQESLGGNSKTTLILACSPCAYNDKETLGTLRFGSRAKNIKNTPIINQEKSSKELKNLLDQAERKIIQQENIIERLEHELKKIGKNDIELTIVEELEKGTIILNKPTTKLESKEIHLTDLNNNNNNDNNDNSNNKETAVKVTSSSNNTPIKPNSNNSLKLLKQHIQISTLSEENKALKYERRDMEKALANRNKEIYSLNEKVISLEDNYNLLWKRYEETSQNSNLQIERLFHNNQMNSNFILSLKTNLSRIKSDFNFLLLGQSLSIFDNNQNISEIELNKQEIIENMHSTIDLIDGIEELLNEKNIDLVGSFTKIPINEEISQINKPLNDAELDNSVGENFSESDDNFYTPLKANQTSNESRKIKKIVNLTQKTEESDGKNEKFPQTMLTEGDYMYENEGEVIESPYLNSKSIVRADGKNYGEQKLIISQRRMIEVLQKANKEMSCRLETFNQIVEKKVKKYKEKIKEVNENSGNKVNNFQQHIYILNETIKERNLDLEKKSMNFEKEMKQKNQELKEMKLHLDQFQKFLIGGKPEAKGLLEYDRKIKDLGVERQKFFNENSNLRKQLDEKTNDLSEKNKLIFTFQTKLTNLTNQYQSLQDKQKNLLEFSQSSNPSNIIKPQRNFKENLGFIDKHIIKPIRGGGGDICNFKRNNLITTINSSDSDSDEISRRKDSIKLTELLTEEKGSNDSSKDSPMKFHKKHSLQQSFRAFDTFIKTKNPEGDRKHLNIETKRIFNKADSMTMELNSANIKPNKLQLSLLDEEDKEFDEFNEFNQAQKFNVERKFKQLNQTSNNVLPAQRVGGAKTSKNLFTKLKKFFI